MLRYLIMHVRGRCRAAEPALPASGADGGSATRVGVHPSVPVSAPLSSTDEWRRARHSADADGVSGMSAVPPTSPPASSAATRSTLAKSVLLVVLLGSQGWFGGCSCFSRNTQDANVVSARQLSLRGIDAQKCGKWDEAETCFADALRRNPADERAHQHYAQVMWQRGQYQAAIAHQNESIRLSGGDPNLLVQLGEMYLSQNNLDAAWECAENAVATNRHLACAWALRGDIYRQQHKWDAALENYHRALSEQPQFMRVQLAEAEVYREQNRPRRALAALEAVISQFPPESIPAEVYYQQGLAYKALARHEDAITVLTLASQAPNASADVFYHLGEAQMLSGNHASARLAVQSALERAPQHASSLRLKEKIDHQNEALTAAIKR